MNITFIPNRSITLVTSDYRVLTATKDNPNWLKIEEAIRNRDEEALISLVSIRETVRQFGNTGEITTRGDKVFYRGVQLFGKDVERILEYLKSGFPAESMILFLERRLKNEFPDSVESLYAFLENRGMPITDRGTVLGYKGVDPEYNSINRGSEPLISGIRNENGSICNKIGQIVAMDRRYVCADRNNPCGPGLHVGSENYARNWAGNGHVMIVEFAPEDVVSVPTVETEKMRVTKYKVVGEIINETYLGGTYNNDYVRPENADDPDVEGDTDEVETDVLTPEIEDAIVPTQEIFDTIKEVQGAAERLIQSNSDFAKGQANGFKDGRGHQKRKFYEEDRGRLFKRWSSEYVEGYLTGYRDGRAINR